MSRMRKKVKHRKYFSSLAMEKKLIKIKGIPAEAVLESLILKISHFGNAISCKWDKTTPNMNEIITGSHKQIIIIEIELERDIPSFIEYEGERLIVNYMDQPPTCAICHSTAHEVGECPRRRTPVNQNYDKNFPQIPDPQQAGQRVRNPSDWRK